MPPSQEDIIQDAITLLSDSRSTKRRSGAKRLRKLGSIIAGPYLLLSLQKEVKDKRTWETQYQMIMALGESGYKDSLSFLNELTFRHFEATMIYLALGDAIVRLDREFPDDPHAILHLLQTKNAVLILGAFRAAAMLKMKPNRHAVNSIIRYVLQHEPEEPSPATTSLRFYVTVACAGWDGPDVDNFLRDSLRSHRSDTRSAAAASQEKRYLKCYVL